MLSSGNLLEETCEAERRESQLVELMMLVDTADKITACHSIRHCGTADGCNKALLVSHCGITA